MTKKNILSMIFWLIVLAALTLNAVRLEADGGPVLLVTLAAAVVACIGLSLSCVKGEAFRS